MIYHIDKALEELRGCDKAKQTVLLDRQTLNHIGSDQFSLVLVGSLLIQF